MLNVTIGIPAFNEERNVKGLISTVLEEISYLKNTPVEIIVASDGSTDQTNEIVKTFIKKNKDKNVSIRLVEKKRGGKVSAINEIIKLSRNEIILLVDADTLPHTPAFKYLLEPFWKYKDCGVANGRHIPTNNKESFWGFCNHAIASLQHLLGLRSLTENCRTKMCGSLYAFRKELISKIPHKVVSDDEYISWAIRKQGYQVVYAPQARILKTEPKTVKDFITVRRRVLAGHYYHRKITGEEVPTISIKVILRPFLSYLRSQKLGDFHKIIVLLTLELMLRLWARWWISKDIVPYMYRAESAELRRP